MLVVTQLVRVIGYVSSSRYRSFERFALVRSPSSPKLAPTTAGSVLSVGTMLRPAAKGQRHFRLDLALSGRLSAGQRAAVSRTFASNSRRPLRLDVFVYAPDWSQARLPQLDRFDAVLLVNGAEVARRRLSALRWAARLTARAVRPAGGVVSVELQLRCREPVSAPSGRRVARLRFEFLSLRPD